MEQSTPPGSSRKRPRENETESQRQKREKAAERQRRKRERDRINSANASAHTTNANTSPPAPTMASLMGFSPNDHPHHHMLHHHPPPPPPPPIPPPVQVLTSPPDNPDNLTPEELARRERVRAAARERQRKHRMLVKQRKLRELGLDMGNEILPGVDDYRFGPPPPDGSYPPVPLPHDLQPHPAHIHDPQQQAFQQAAAAAASTGQPTSGLGGQTFASTLLLSFSCAPLLKQHLLRTLHMSNEELASLEPILAEAWERWDHAVRPSFFLPSSLHIPSHLNSAAPTTPNKPPKPASRPTPPQAPSSQSTPPSPQTNNKPSQQPGSSSLPCPTPMVNRTSSASGSSAPWSRPHRFGRLMARTGVEGKAAGVHQHRRVRLGRRRRAGVSLSIRSLPAL